MTAKKEYVQREAIRNAHHFDEALRNDLAKAETQLTDVRDHLRRLGYEAQKPEMLAALGELEHQLAQLQTRIARCEANQQYSVAATLRTQLPKIQSRINAISELGDSKVDGLRERERALVASVAHLRAAVRDQEAAWRTAEDKRLAKEAAAAEMAEFEAEEAAEKQKRFNEWRDQVS